MNLLEKINIGNIHVTPLIFDGLVFLLFDIFYNLSSRFFCEGQVQVEKQKAN